MLAARRSLAVVVSVRVNRRGEGRAATELNVRMTSVGAQRCGQNGARCARRHDRCALDKVGGADKERRPRGSALSRRRRVSSSEQARRGQSSNGAEREDDVGRRSAVRLGRRTRRTTTRSACVDEVGGAIKERRARGSALARRRRFRPCQSRAGGAMGRTGAVMSLATRRRPRRRGARVLRRNRRCAHDRVGGARSAEQLARGPALARRRRPRL